MASSIVTKDIESRLKNQPEHIFEVFLEIHEPIGNEPPAILITYPNDYSDEILRTAANFAYPCRVPADEQSEHFTFVVLDATGSIFRFGYCRRSNRESTCLCLISYYPWFETFYTILNDLSQIINSKSFNEVETFLMSLHNYSLLSFEEFYKREGQETIEICLSSQHFRYNRPDLRKLPSVLSNRNFSVMFSLLGTEIMLRLFSHLLFERRILFVSSKLFHLTACACGCLHLIYPMHWQSIFLPILPESLSWTSQCTAPFILGVHSSIYSKLNRKELADVIIVNIDQRTLESPYDDLNLFPKDLLRSMKKGIEQSSQLIGDHLARVFLRSMAFIVGDYGNGFVIKNNKLDFDRDLYLEPFRQTPMFLFMSSIVNTQIFEQFSRYRTSLQLQREIDVDEFDIEVNNFQRTQQSKKQTTYDLFSKLKSNKKMYKMLEKATNPLIEQVQDKTEQLQAAMNKIGIRSSFETAATPKHHSPSNDRFQSDSTQTVNAAAAFPVAQIQAKKSNLNSRSSTPELFVEKQDPLIVLDFEQNCLFSSPIVVDVIQSSSPAQIARQPIQIDSKIKELQNVLQHKVQTSNHQRIDPRDDYGDDKTNIDKLVQQFDPLDVDSYTTNNHVEQLYDTVPLRSRISSSDVDTSSRHPSTQETISNNHVRQILQTFASNYGTNPQANAHSTTENPCQPSCVSSSETKNSDLIDFN